MNLSKTDIAKSASGTGPPIMAFIGDVETLELVVRVVPGARRGVEVHEGGIQDAITRAQGGEVPALLIVDISDTAQPGADMTRLKELTGPAATIVALGPDNDISLYRSLVTAGATDYLVLPVTAQDLRRTILSVSHADNGADEIREGRLIGLVGARGGVGTSSLAVGLGWQLAHDFAKQVAILDLDLHFGTAALSFDVDPGRGLRDALRDPERIDSLLVASALVNVADNLYVLGSEEPLDEPSHVGGEAVVRLIEEMRSQVDVIVIDLPRHQLPDNLELLGRCDGLALVTDLTLPSLRDAVRIRRLIESQTGHQNFKVVANRVGHAKGGELSATDFEQSLGAKLDFNLPELPMAAKAAMDGKPVVAGFKSRGAGESFRTLVKTLSMLDEAAPAGHRRRLIGRRLFGLKL